MTPLESDALDAIDRLPPPDRPDLLARLRREDPRDVRAAALRLLHGWEVREGGPVDCTDMTTEV